MKTVCDNSQLRLFGAPSASRTKNSDELKLQLKQFDEFGEATKMIETNVVVEHGANLSVDTFVNEFWTAKQRRASSLHEISYRACFKPQLPRFFIERLTAENDTVYDPFVGRGTTMIEAALLGRRVAGCDINPLSSILTAPRLRPPTVRDVLDRLANLDWNYEGELNEELLTFYHPDTLREICALRSHLLSRDGNHSVAEVDDWIRMVATNR